MGRYTEEGLGSAVVKALSGEDMAGLDGTAGSRQEHPSYRAVATHAGHRRCSSWGSFDGRRGEVWMFGKLRGSEASRGYQGSSAMYG